MQKIISPERYALIKPLPKIGEFFMRFPGIYCKKCGKDFVLYSYGICQPHGIDENEKPFYNKCSLCSKEESITP
jgi:hypothetical protein